MEQNRRGNGQLSLLMALRLAAPHTWAASLIPALLGAALTAGAASVQRLQLGQYTWQLGGDGHLTLN